MHFKPLLWIAYWSVATFILLEAVFRFLPVSNGFYEINPDHPLNPNAPHFRSNSTFVRQTGHDFSHAIQKTTNNLGYFQDSNYTTKDHGNNIVIIGDSYVEAVQIPNKESITGLLDTYMQTKHQKAFAFALSGSPLSQYLHFAKTAHSILNPNAYVFVVIANDFDESLLHYNPRPPFALFDDAFNLQILHKDRPWWIKTLLRSAFMRYLFVDLSLHWRIPLWLKSTPQNTLQEAKMGIKQGDTQKTKLSKQAIDAFFAQLKPITKDKPVVFVLDPDRIKIYTGQQGQTPYVSDMYAYFKATAPKSWIVIDLQYAFQTHFNTHQKRFDFPYDFHWNALGHTIASEAIIEVLERLFDPSMR